MLKKFFKPKARKSIVLIGPHFAEYCRNLGVALSARFDVVLIVDADGYKRECVPDSELRSEFRIKTNNFKNLGDLLDIVCTIVRTRPDNVHLQEAAGPRRALFLAVAAFVATILGARVTLTVHDVIGHLGNDLHHYKRSYWPRQLVRLQARNVIVHGATAAKVLSAESWVSNKRVVTTAHGTILASEHELPAPAIPTFLFFGRMEAYKGIDVLLQAIALLPAEGLKIIIAGRGEELDKYASRFAQYPQIVLRNEFIPREELIDLIASSDCVLLPYREATQSGVLSGAFSNGCCVIATRVGGLPDFARDGENALLVDPESPEQLATAIERIAIDADLKRRLRRGALVTSKTEMNWNRIVEETLVVYGG